ncbi:MAG: class I SAM-dependent RNA methyltransferase [Gemmatimonadetes bacterium]|nr:MAG: class I SAM-dependent RNA methyltransferase [Gemmatimonadota bacterium]
MTSGDGRPDAGTENARASAGEGLETVDITALAAGGEGVGTLASGKVVFVPRTAPGDRVRVRVERERARWARARLEVLEQPGPERIEPPCPLYDRCGGCQLQHLAYEAQVRWKGRFVADALARIGGVGEHAVEVHPAPRPFEYRTRVRFTLRRLPGGRVVAGFHQLGRPARLVDVDDTCLLPTPALRRAWGEVRAAWGEGARLLPAGRSLELTLREVEEGPVLLVEGGEGPGRPDRILAGAPSLAAVWMRPRGGPAVHAAGAPTITERRGGARLAVGPATFVQVNAEAAAALEDAVVKALGPVDGRRVVDAYAGAGLLARRLAAAGATVVAIEREPDAVRAALAAAPSGLVVAEGSVEERLPGALPADAVVLNPPRAGIAPEVAEALRAAPSPTLVYVSCDPATLARDLERLAATYDIVSVSAYDLFPQTAHVETLAVLTARSD